MCTLILCPTTTSPVDGVCGFVCKRRREWEGYISRHEVYMYNSIDVTRARIEAERMREVRILIMLCTRRG